MDCIRPPLHRTPLQIAGAWRLWPERSEREPQQQGTDTSEATSTNPEHVFEIHPVTYVGTASILDTLKEVQGFEPKDAVVAFRNLSRCHAPLFTILNPEGRP